VLFDPLDRSSCLSRCVIGFRWWPMRGRFSGARMLAGGGGRPSPTSSMGGGSSSSKTARAHPLIDVPQQHVTRCVHQACSSTHKASLAIMLSWIWQWWRLDVSSNVRLGGAGVGHRPLASVVAVNPRDRFLFLNLS
jgi:hypothetical protein